MNKRTQQQEQRNQQRREQILNAAEACFCRYGFHAASIASISKASQTSVGQIYHYFKNKEAIIAAIVEGDSNKVRQQAEQLNNPHEPLELLAHFERMLEQMQLNPQKTALKLEIVAEAARNSHIAAMLCEAEQKNSEAYLRAICAGLERSGMTADEERIRGIVTIIAAILRGLCICHVFRQGLDCRQAVQLMDEIIRLLLSNQPAKLSAQQGSSVPETIRRGPVTAQKGSANAKTR